MITLMDVIRRRIDRNANRTTTDIIDSWEDGVGAEMYVETREMWCEYLLDEVDRLTEELADARSAAEEDADHYAEAARDWKREARPPTIRTPTEADSTPAGTVLLDKIGDVWQHNIEPATLWEDRLDSWTTPGDEEGYDANEPAYPARIIYQPEEQTDE